MERAIDGALLRRLLLAAREGGVDLVVSNPPYIPEGAQLQPEVMDYDPHTALFGGADGLSVIKPMISNIARWLRIGGAAGIEHDDCISSKLNMSKYLLEFVTDLFFAESAEAVESCPSISIASVFNISMCCNNEMGY